MNIKMKILIRDENCLAEIIKQMCDWSAKVNMDLVKGEIEISGASVAEKNSIVDTVSKGFFIVGLETEFSESELSSKEVILENPISETETTEETKEAAEVSAETTETTDVQEVGKESENGTAARPEFNLGEEIRGRLRHLKTILSYNLNVKEAPEEDLIKFIKSAGIEVGMKYNPREIPKFEVGDIVQCNFGHHLDGELYGGYVFGIVCDISDNTFYVVPITKKQLEDSCEYMPFIAGVDVDYYDPSLEGGTALLRMGGTYNRQRVNAVVGRVRDSFFTKMIEALSRAFIFTNTPAKQDESVDEVETQPVAEETTAEPTEKVDTSNEAEGVENAETVDEEKSEEKADTSTSKEDEVKEAPKQTAEEFIKEEYGNVFACIDPSAPVEGQVDDLVRALGFDPTNDIIRYAFVVSTQTDKINYSNIQGLLIQVLPDTNYDQAQEVLKKEFKKWMEANPRIKEKYPKIGMTTILKVFARSFNNSK